MKTAGTRWWLFSAPLDLAVFLGSALVALTLVPLGGALGVDATGESPEWTWLAGVLLVDVAHVYSTAFVVYLEPKERTRRHAYWVVPVVAYLFGVALYGAGAALFWRVLAYLALFHFVRQQYGWVMLYRARMGERDRLGRLIDGAAVYAATLYPVIWWHANLPREFAWFMNGDFAALPSWAATAAAPIYVAVLAAYAARALPGWLRGRPHNPGKDMIVATTAACWYAGIVATNSDYAFTVTNVFVHGLPYLALVFVVARAPRAEGAPGLGARIVAAGPLAFLGALWVCAYAEELLWDQSVWHERSWLFGGGTDVSAWHALIVPLLAVPQITHYVLDGFLWRRGKNPRVKAALDL